MQIPKHIDPTPPLDVIRKVYELLKAGDWLSLDLWANLGYLVAWSLDFLSRKAEPDGPIFGAGDPCEAEFCQMCVEIHDWATEGDLQVQRSAIGAWLVKAMLLALLNRVLAELAKNGLPDWLAEMIRQVKEAIEEL